MQLSTEDYLRRIGRRMEAAGRHVALYATVLVLASIGGLKFTAYEAEGLRPLIETSPLLSWAYSVFSLQAFSNLLGVVELATALLLALAPVAPRLGIVGGALATATFAVTSTLLVTGPSWEASLGGFPALSPFGAFVIKDLVLLGVALAVLGRSLGGAAEGLAARPILSAGRPFGGGAAAAGDLPPPS